MNQELNQALKIKSLDNLENLENLEGLKKIEVNEEEVIVSPEQVGDDCQASFHVVLSLDEKIKCIEEILSKVKKILYVYDKSQEENSAYNYKVYIGGILIYVSSSNVLFRGDLVSVVINLNAILINDFGKAQLKRIVFETKNMLEFMLKKYGEEYEKIKIDYESLLKSPIDESDNQQKRD